MVGPGGDLLQVIAGPWRIASSTGARRGRVPAGRLLRAHGGRIGQVGVDHLVETIEPKTIAKCRGLAP